MKAESGIFAFLSYYYVLPQFCFYFVPHLFLRFDIFLYLCTRNIT